MDALAPVWRKYKDCDDRNAKDELTLNYLHVVKSVVRRMLPKYNMHNEYEDLVSVGVLGLIDAIERFDIERDVKFEGYAATRIKGEVIDYLRTQDWASPDLRKRISTVSKAYEDAERQGSSLSDDEVASATGMSVRHVREALQQAHTFNVMSFEDALSDIGRMPDVAAPESEEPETRYLDTELRAQLAAIIDELPERERHVLTMYYYEGFLLNDIAKVLGISESRASQIHSHTIADIRRKLIRNGIIDG